MPDKGQPHLGYVALGTDVATLESSKSCFLKAVSNTALYAVLDGCDVSMHAGSSS